MKPRWPGKINELLNDNVKTSLDDINSKLNVLEDWPIKINSLLNDNVKTGIDCINNKLDKLFQKRKRKISEMRKLIAECPTVKCEDSVIQCAKIMRTNGVRFCKVEDQSGEYCGMVFAAEVMKCIAEIAAKDLEKQTCQQYMVEKEKVKCVSLDDTLEMACDVMMMNNIAQVCIKDDRNIIGCVNRQFLMTAQSM